MRLLIGIIAFILIVVGVAVALRSPDASLSSGAGSATSSADMTATSSATTSAATSSTDTQGAGTTTQHSTSTAGVIRYSASGFEPAIVRVEPESTIRIIDDAAEPLQLVVHEYRNGQRRTRESWQFPCTDNSCDTDERRVRFPRAGTYQIRASSSPDHTGQIIVRDRVRVPNDDR